MKAITQSLLFAAFLLAFSCKHQDKEECEFVPDSGQITINLSWESLESQLPSVTTKVEVVDFFGKHPTLRDEFFHRGSYPDDSAFVHEMYQRFTNPHIDTLLMETQRTFGDGSELKRQFEDAFRNFRYYYPTFQPPRIQTVLTGLETDLYVSDTLVIIGLDHYLGPQAKYSLNMYEYMKRRYTSDFIVPSVMLLYGIDAKYNAVDPSDRTVLADMIAYGKAYHFAKQMSPCLPDSILMAYTSEEISGSRANESLIWSRFVEDQVLYSTSGIEKQKYLNERPKTVEVGEKCPGRIGQWIGWQIIRQYSASHPEATLPQIMSLDNASTLFKESGYKPQVVSVSGKKKI